jgi:CRISPR type III-A-associated protein Csm2
MNDKKGNNFGSLRDFAKAEGHHVPEPQSPNRRPFQTSGSPQPSSGLKGIWPPDYLNKGYFNAQGVIREELLDRKHMCELVKCVEVSLNNSQLRRFFQHGRQVETLLKNRKPWAEVRPELQKMQNAAAYAWKDGKEGKAANDPKKDKIPKVFHDFIIENIDAVLRGKDDTEREKFFVHGFMPHFEALVAYSAGKLDNNKRRN